MVIFAGDDLSTPQWFSEDDAARVALSFVTTADGDADDSFFDACTPAQATWRDTCAEKLGLALYDHHGNELGTLTRYRVSEDATGTCPFQVVASFIYDADRDSGA
jgi:hypothetical protein